MIGNPEDSNRAEVRGQQNLDRRGVLGPKRRHRSACARMPQSLVGGPNTEGGFRSSNLPVDSNHGATPTPPAPGDRIDARRSVLDLNRADHSSLQVVDPAGDNQLAAGY